MTRHKPKHTPSRGIRAIAGTTVLAVALSLVAGIALAAAGDAWFGRGPLFYEVYTDQGEQRWTYGTRTYTNPFNGYYGAWEDSSVSITMDSGPRTGYTLVAEGRIFGAEGGPIAFRSTSVRLLDPTAKPVCRRGSLVFGGNVGSDVYLPAELELPSSCPILQGLQYPLLRVDRTPPTGWTAFTLYER